MDAVGDGIDRDFLGREVWPEGLPHLPGDLAMSLGDGVVEEAHPERKRGHIETGARVVRIFPEGHELVPVEAQRRAVIAEVLCHQVFGEDVVGGWHRGMGGEDGCSPDPLTRLLRRQPGLEPLPEPLKKGERRVPFV